MNKTKRQKIVLLFGEARSGKDYFSYKFREQNLSDEDTFRERNIVFTFSTCFAKHVKNFVMDYMFPTKFFDNLNLYDTEILYGDDKDKLYYNFNDRSVTTEPKYVAITADSMFRLLSSKADDIINGLGKDSSITMKYSMTIRELLVYIGTYIGKNLNPKLWIFKTLRELDDDLRNVTDEADPNMDSVYIQVITDLRFEDELQSVEDYVKQKRRKNEVECELYVVEIKNDNNTTGVKNIAESQYEQIRSCVKDSSVVNKFITFANIYNEEEYMRRLKEVRDIIYK